MTIMPTVISRRQAIILTIVTFMVSALLTGGVVSIVFHQQRDTSVVRELQREDRARQAANDDANQIMTGNWKSKN